MRWSAHSLRFTCHAGWELFSSEPARKTFLRCLERARQEMRFDLWAYVVMPEHVHVLLWPRQDLASMASIAEAIRMPMEKSALRNGLIPGPPFWDWGAAFDHPFHDVREVHQEMVRLHSNPVRAGLVERQEQWSYSSAAFWMGVGTPLLEMDVTVPRLEEQDPDVC